MQIALSTFPATPPLPRLIRVTLRGAALRFKLLCIRFHRNLEHSTRAAVQQCHTVGNVHHGCLLLIVQLSKLCTVGKELFVLIGLFGYILIISYNIIFN